MHIKEIDLDIDYDKLLETFNNFRVLYSTEYSMISLLEKHARQIAVQCRQEADGIRQITESCNSLIYDWDNFDPKIHSEPPKRDVVLSEKLFDVTCDIFKGNYIGHVVEKVKQQYGAYRGRFMMMKYKTCLSMHVDETPRLHIPIITNPDSFMVIDDQICRFPFGKAYIANTLLPHTAVNAGKKDRTHLVFCVDK